ncbi:hypothetical protein [Mycoplasma leonicaptivi]|uniref:hypothetical protein n=1 Tax=Mycoplasma leonicaptivi TaxID=36742 RepID=UPI0004883D21|nr:hypothetical protein [Mycoplasma leonicaptivi]
MFEKFKKVLIPEGSKISKRENAWYVQIVTKREYIKEKGYYKETKLAVGRVVTQNNEEKYMYPNINYFIHFKNGKIELNDLAKI